MPHHSHPDVLPRFEDAFGKEREAPQETVGAIARAMGHPSPGVDTSVLVLTAGQSHNLTAPAELSLEEIPLMQDLPTGVDPDGAEAWIWQEVLADSFTVGSPPDQF